MNSHRSSESADDRVHKGPCARISVGTAAMGPGGFVLLVSLIEERPAEAAGRSLTRTPLYC